MTRMLQANPTVAGGLIATVAVFGAACGSLCTASLSIEPTAVADVGTGRGLASISNLTVGSTWVGLAAHYSA